MYFPASLLGFPAFSSISCSRSRAGKCRLFGLTSSVRLHLFIQYDEVGIFEDGENYSEKYKRKWFIYIYLRRGKRRERTQSKTRNCQMEGD